MKVYFSESKIEELIVEINKILPLFPLNEQSLLMQFVADIVKGNCEIEQYNNIYSLLNRDMNKKSKEQGKQKTNKNKQKTQEEDDVAMVLLEMLNLLRYKFATKYYLSGVINKCELSNGIDRG